MGVQGLWTIVQPCARPVKLETLNRKRLAVDASIWIYQFLKAVRDKEGNALRNSHVVGFFRRICKLLYFGIKPVFVFDGGAPVLKRQTIANRKKRREGRREDAVRTAGKLLAVQLQRTAEQEAATRKARTTRQEPEVEEVPDNPVYVDEAFMTEKEKQQSRKFKKKDAYHLPDMQVSLQEMGAPNDPRIMSREELEQYALQFHQGEDINLYDFSKINFDSPFFLSLPATDRYNILNAARLRSRLRMGYSKEQLDNMFPDRMAFSKFQIERVKERNDLTQRLMNINGMNGDEAFYNSGQRIAGERGKEYVLVQDSAVEGGWVLGVVGNKEGQEEKPIDVDRYFQHEIVPETKDSSDDEDGFEDVPIEGLNRLPKLPFLRQGVLDDSLRQHMQDTAGVYDAEADALFVPDHGQSAQLHGRSSIDDVFKGRAASEDEDLQRAIEMSLQSAEHMDHDHDMPEIPVNQAIPSAPSIEFAIEPLIESDDDELDFSAALAQSKPTKKEPAKPSTSKPVPSHPFEGPLPFETLKLGKPFKTKQQTSEKAVEEDAGGFEKQSSKVTKENVPLPPWFSGGQQAPEFIAEKDQADSLESYRDRAMTPDHMFLKNHRSPSVIDVDKFPDNAVIDLDPEPSNKVEEIHQVQTTVEDELKDETLQNPIDITDKEVPHALEVTETPKASANPLNPEIDAESLRDDFEWEATDDEKAEKSPSPEFEDVPMQSEEVDSGPVIHDAETTEPIDYVDEDTFSDPEDEELLRQLAAEGEEHVRFAATLNSATQPETSFDYEQELKQLRVQQKKDRRDADEVTQVMITECQQLLTLFGLPYITAPMEAEAQCAELVSLGLVDGIITDDSDIFLFGGTRVYKNMFNQSKYVECYLTSDLEKEYALHRKKLISFAHLLGSDYTEGIPGIGPVTALEILTEFSALDEFHEWWTRVQTGADMSDSSHASFYKKFRKQATKIFLPPTFPDTRVDEAYLQPEADSDPSPFQWGVPDLHGLRSFLMATIGWSQERTDEVLVPVIRDMNSREQVGTQSNITNFFSGPQGAGAFAPRVRSGGQSRMEKAFGRLRREAGADPVPEESSVDQSQDQVVPQQSRKGKSCKRGAPESGNSVENGDGAQSGDGTITKRRRGRKGAKI
ncbi:single-stranded DNA endonuclease [Aspergillus ustus]|uniref:Single-stranded DNA endonuclease n=1 Tax=Aspergillus ustus TaxID=40382 RepID=A0A0C1EGH6_ASPUT|nr:single-stranded DNA endonuclease [Aspergillus ustus]